MLKVKEESGRYVQSNSRRKWKLKYQHYTTIIQSPKTTFRHSSTTDAFTPQIIDLE